MEYHSAGNRLHFMVITLLLLYIAPDLIYLFIDADHSITEKISYLMMTVGLGLLPFLLFRNRLKILAIVIFILFIVFGIISTGIVIFYKARMSVNTLGNIINTNKAEASEFMQGMMFVSVISLLIITGIFIYVFLKIPNKLSSKNTKHFIFTSISCIVLSTAYFLVINKTSVKNFVKNNLYKEYYPIYVFKSATTYYREELKLQDNYEKAKSFSFGAKSTDSTSERKIFLLLIGESCRYANWSINGYERKTSPRIEAQGLLTYHDVITSHNSTIKSVAMMVTPCGAEDFNKHSEQRSILALFKEAGYKTYWISNQNDWGAAPIKIHMKDADSIFCSNGTRGVTLEHDDRLLPKVNNIMNQQANLLIVVHLTGNHWSYQDRYPDSFILFGGKSKNQNENYFDKANKQQLIDSYDNCIYYQDYIISEFVKLLEKQNCIGSLMYIPDHGENLFDDSRNLTGHGASFTEASFRVPLFIYNTNKLKAKQPDNIQALTNNAHKPVIANEAIFYSLADLAKIDFASNKPNKSFASSSYSPPQKRKILLPDNSVVNFEDEVVKEQKLIKHHDR